MGRLSTGKCWACGKPIERGLILCDDCEPACEFCGAATAEDCHCADGYYAYALALTQREDGAGMEAAR